MDEEASIILGMPSPLSARRQDARLINMLGQSRAISLTEDTLTIEASRFAIAQLKKHQPTIEAYLKKSPCADCARHRGTARRRDGIRCRDGARHGSRCFPGGAGLRRRRADNRAPAQRCFP
ncbi:MAG: hypothetical protein ACLTXI_10385 [Collinsella sp.]